jgi:GAF domain-containing protein
VVLRHPVTKFVDFVRTGYPTTAPVRPHQPLFALLRRRLSADELLDVARRLAGTGPPIVRGDVSAAIRMLLNDDCCDDDVVRVSAYLAGRGWLVMDGDGRTVGGRNAEGFEDWQPGVLSGPALVERMARLAPKFAGPRAVEDVFTAVCAAAVELIPGADLADVMLVRDGGAVSSVGATSDLAAQLDDVQQRLGEGPCAQAATDAVVVRCDDLATDGRWPRYGLAAAALGVRSAMSFKLYCDGDRAATLNVYGCRTDGWDDDAETVGATLAAHAAAAIDASVWGAELHAPLASRDVVGQAKGVLMERYGLDGVGAFELLSQVSREQECGLLDLARGVIATRTEGYDERKDGRTDDQARQRG